MHPLQVLREGFTYIDWRSDALTVLLVALHEWGFAGSNSLEDLDLDRIYPSTEFADEP